MKKNKERAPSSIRTYDKDGFRRRAACVCVKDEFEDEVLLVSRPRQINQWIFPGGGIEPKEDPRHAASREVVEEAGVIGSIIRCLGVFETEQTRTCVYVLQVSLELNEWDDSIKCGRKRMWFSIEGAKSALGEGHAQLAYLTRLKNSPAQKVLFKAIPNPRQPSAAGSSSFCLVSSSSTPSSSYPPTFGFCCSAASIFAGNTSSSSSYSPPRTNHCNDNSSYSNTTTTTTNTNNNFGANPKNQNFSSKPNSNILASASSSPSFTKFFQEPQQFASTTPNSDSVDYYCYSKKPCSSNNNIESSNLKIMKNSISSYCNVSGDDKNNQGNSNCYYYSNTTNHHNGCCCDLAVDSGINNNSNNSDFENSKSNNNNKIKSIILTNNISFSENSLSSEEETSNSNSLITVNNNSNTVCNFDQKSTNIRGDGNTNNDDNSNENQIDSNNTSNLTPDR